MKQIIYKPDAEPEPVRELELRPSNGQIAVFMRISRATEVTGWIKVARFTEEGTLIVSASLPDFLELQLTSSRCIKHF